MTPVHQSDSAGSKPTPNPSKDLDSPPMVTVLFIGKPKGEYPDWDAGMPEPDENLVTWLGDDDA